MVISSLIFMFRYLVIKMFIRNLAKASQSNHMSWLLCLLNYRKAKSLETSFASFPGYAFTYVSCIAMKIEQLTCFGARFDNLFRKY